METKTNNNYMKGFIPYAIAQFAAGNRKTCYGSDDVDFGNFLEVFDGVVINHLDGGKIGTVVQDDEAELLGGAAVAHPATDGDGLACEGRGVAEQLADADEFHSESTFLVVQSIAQIIRQIVGIYKPFS